MSKNTVNCTESQLQSFIENSRFILVRQFPTPDDESSITTAQIVSMSLVVLCTHAMLLERRLFVEPYSQH